MAALPLASHPKKRAVLKAYARVGTITQACAAAKVTPRTHRDWMKADADYAEAFGEAREAAADSLEREAIHRARDGWREPVYQGGKLVGHILKKSDTLLIFMLKAVRPEKFRERQEISGPNGGPIETSMVDLSKLTPEQLATMRTWLSQAQ